MPRTLSLDQERVLDEVLRLANLGFDAPPGNIAHALGMPLERVKVALVELGALGLQLSTVGRAPRC